MAGCSDVYAPSETTDPNVPVDYGLTWFDEIALTRLMATHTTDVDTLGKMVNGVLQGGMGKGSARSVAEVPVITGVRKVTSIPPKSFTSGGVTGRSIAPESEEPVELYTFEVTDPVKETNGYILASNDNRIGNILAIVENGEFDDPEDPFTRMLHKNLEAYIDTTIAIYGTLTDADALAAFEKLRPREEGRKLISHWDEVKEYLSLGYYIDPIYDYMSDFQVVREPLITTKWNQNAPYNNYLNYALYLEGQTNKNYKAGCIPVALAQLVTYYQYMNPITPTVAAFNQPTIGSWNPKAGLWTGQYNWTSMKNVSTLTEGNTALVGQIGVLLYQIGKNLGVEYGSQTGLSLTINTTTYQASSTVLMSTLQAMGYNTGNGFRYVPYVENTPAGVAYRNTRKNTLDQGHPYFVVGVDENLGMGHAWLVDGYGTMTYYYEALIYPGSTTPIVVQILLSNDRMMVHCNMGNSIGNGWYIDGLFDVANMASFPGNDIGPDGSPDFSSYVNWMAPIPN